MRMDVWDTMKKNSRLFMIFIVAAVLFSGCNKENQPTNAKKEHTDHSNSVAENSSKPASKVAKNVKPVAGAKIGSLSSYVEDREVWKDIVDKKYIDFAKRNEFGIHVPRILLGSEDAKAANNELDGLVKRIKDVYDSNKKYMEGFDTGIYTSFSVYQDENVLSVMIKNANIWEGELPQYTVFNFSLPDGKFIDDDELMNNFGVEKGELLGIIENSLREKQSVDTSIYFRNVTDSSYIYNPNNYTGLIFNDLWDHYSPKSRQIFIDEVGAPFIVFTQYSSAEMGKSPAILKLRSDEFGSNPISDEYLRMARRLGIDPNDKKHKAFVIFLGSASDEASLKDPLAKLYAWTSVFSNDEDPNMLIAMKESEGGNMPYLIGEECYLIIPKYRNASVSIKELEPMENGQLKELKNAYLDNLSATGVTFVCQNISDIAPNGKITIRYRDDVLEFSPSISLKDGSLMLPDQVTNGEDVLDWKSLVKKDDYSYPMFERIQFIMGVG